MSAKRPKGLGRGLSALMADVEEATTPSTTAGEPKERTTVPIEKVHPNPNQPRRQFDREKLQELADSVRAKGIIQPLIVRERPNDSGSYEIVAGERRWRAAQLANLHEVPVVIRSYTDIEVLEIAILENIQRADLNPVEEALGYRQLMDSFGHTQEKMAESLGKSRSHIANMLRLLNLPEDVQTLLQEQKITAGHARALITADNASDIAKQIVAKGLSVRAVENLLKAKPKSPKASAVPSSSSKSADTVALEGDLSAAVGMRVQIHHKSGSESGKIEITYDDLDALDRLCAILSRGDL